MLDHAQRVSEVVHDGARKRQQVLFRRANPVEGPFRRRWGTSHAILYRVWYIGGTVSGLRLRLGPAKGKSPGTGAGALLARLVCGRRAGARRGDALSVLRGGMLVLVRRVLGRRVRRRRVLPSGLPATGTIAALGRWRRRMMCLRRRRMTLGGRWG